MDSFKIAFWNLPVSKDDSFIGLPQAELVHALVNVTSDGKTKTYIVELLSEEWKKQVGVIELVKTIDDHWNLVNGKEMVEGIFPRIVQAIEDAETSMQDQPERVIE